MIRYRAAPRRVDEDVDPSRFVHIWVIEALVPHGQKSGPALCGTTIDTHPECFTKDGWPMVAVGTERCPSCGRLLCPRCLLFLGAEL